MINNPPAGSREPGVDEDICQRCQGNGEIVTDLDRYLHPAPGDSGDEAVDTCPTCNGTGKEGRHSICRDCEEVPAGLEWRQRALFFNNRQIGMYGMNYAYLCGDIIGRPGNQEASKQLLWEVAKVWLSSATALAATEAGK